MFNEASPKCPIATGQVSKLLVPQHGKFAKLADGLD